MRSALGLDAADLRRAATPLGLARVGLVSEQGVARADAMVLYVGGSHRTDESKGDVPQGYMVTVPAQMV